MPKATKSSAWGGNQVPQPEEMIPSSQEELSNSDLSWCLSTEELTLDTICGKFEEFFKPQSNEVRAYFDLLTSFGQGNKRVDE